jgi:outer membrane protein OmpA-like peptidoglycan-associated protein
MKNFYLATILAASIVAAPAFAQTTSAPPDQSATAPAAASSAPQPMQSAPATTSSDQAASSTASTTASSSTDSATGKPLQPPAREGFWGRMNPFARKKYVQKQTAPIRDRINELDELTAANSKQIKDVDARAQEGIRQAQQKATEADQHAVDAGNKAQAAQQTATQATARLGTVEQVVGNIDQYKPINETEIRFRQGQTVLSTNAKSALDDMAHNLKNQRGYVIQVQGFSSGQGQAAIATSQKMADSVVRYLVLNHEIPVYRIFVVGMGNAPVASNDETTKASKTRHASGGRVEVSLMKNDLEQLSASSTAPVATTTAPQQQKQ